MPPRTASLREQPCRHVQQGPRLSAEDDARGRLLWHGHREQKDGHQTPPPQHVRHAHETCPALQLHESPALPCCPVPLETSNQRHGRYYPP